MPQDMVLFNVDTIFRLISLNFYKESLNFLEILIPECTFTQISSEDEHCSIKKRILKLNTLCG